MLKRVIVLVIAFVAGFSASFTALSVAADAPWVMFTDNWR